MNRNVPIGVVFYIVPNFLSEDGEVINRRLMLCIDACETGLILIPTSSIKEETAAIIRNSKKYMVCPESAGFIKPTYFKLCQRYIIKWEDLPRRGIQAKFTVPEQTVKEIIRKKIQFKSVIIRWM